MATSGAALTKLVKANDRLLKAEAATAELRAARDEALREAMEHSSNTYVLVNERTGLSRATIAKALRRQ